MANFTAVYYREPDGSEPVSAFLHELPPRARAAVRNQLDRLNHLSDDLPHLPFPHSSQVAGDLRELRCHFGPRHYRVIYARSDRLMVLLHAFPKNTGQIPQGEIDVARQRLTSFKERMNTTPRRRPRAVGHDAP